ncbi:hypothetical protein BH23BAC3_BH23BAC3_24380 [soil metagenome]
MYSEPEKAMEKYMIGNSLSEFFWRFLNPVSPVTIDYKIALSFYLWLSILQT